MGFKIVDAGAEITDDYDFTFLKKHEVKIWVFLMVNSAYLFGVFYGIV